MGTMFMRLLGRPFRRTVPQRTAQVLDLDEYLKEDTVGPLQSPHRNEIRCECRVALNQDRDGCWGRIAKYSPRGYSMLALRQSVTDSPDQSEQATSLW